MNKRWMRITALWLIVSVIFLNTSVLGEALVESAAPDGHILSASETPAPATEVSCTPETAIPAVTETMSIPTISDAPAADVPDTDVSASDTPAPSDVPAVSEPVLLEATPTVTEAVSTIAPTALPFSKGYVSVPAGTWFYMTRFADASKQAFRTDADSVGYAFDARVNSQGVLWAEVGFAMRQGNELVMKVGYIPAHQVTILGNQANPEWIAASAAAPGSYYLLGENADRPLPVAYLTLAPRIETPEPAADDTTSPESRIENQASEETPSAETIAPTAQPETSQPDTTHAAETSEAPSTGLPQTEMSQTHAADQPATATELGDVDHSHDGENNISTDASVVSPSDMSPDLRKVWIEVERPEAGLYRGDKVTLRAVSAGFEATPSFQWEYRISDDSEWVVYDNTDSTETDTLILEVDAENVAWHWRVVAK